MRNLKWVFVALGVIAYPFPPVQGQSDLQARIQKLEARGSALEADNVQLKQTIEQLRRPGSGNSPRPAGGADIAEAAAAKQCGNQLKTIGLAFHIYSVDHADQLPFRLPAAEGWLQGVGIHRRGGL